MQYYACLFCVKTDRSNLTVHIRSHTGERPFKCQWQGCTKAFPTSSTLKRHMRTHTDERPFECNFCKKRFRQSTTRNKHERNCLAISVKQTKQTKK